MSTLYFALHVTTMALSAILIGANISLLHEYRGILARWFSVKIFAVIGLLTYIFASASYGNPGLARIIIALVAIAFDIYAVKCMWKAIARSRRRRIVLLAAGEPSDFDAAPVYKDI